MLVLILGGIRSGKSGVAEQSIAEMADGRAVTYVATARVDPADHDHAARIERHRQARPDHWTTVECPDAGDLGPLVHGLAGPVLIDSLGSWVTSALFGPEPADLDTGRADLVAVLAGRDHPTVAVSEEVGLSVHSPSDAGRRFADELGLTNQAVAARAGRVVLVVAGRTIEL